MSAAAGIMPLSEIRPGMEGYGKTVFSGSKVEKFGVRVVGVIPKAGLAGDDLILIRVFGNRVEKMGGVSMGMSGSPVYIKDRLIGAVSMTFAEDENMLGGVTPIEAMRKILDYAPKESGGPGVGGRLLDKPLRVGENIYRKISYCPPDCGAESGTLHASLAVAPVLVQGLSERSFRYLKKSFERGGLATTPVYRMLAGGSGSAATGGGKLEPGSSIAAMLVKGDINVAAIGTLTEISGKRVLTFGHPMFRKGKVKYLLADAPVYDIVMAETPYKMATTGAARGVFLEDRGAALTGVLDTFPELIPVSITVRDNDVGVERNVSVKIVDDRELLPSLVLSVLLQAMDNSVDRIGEGTSRLSFKMGIRGFDGSIERDNMYYNRYDVSLESLSDIFTALDFIMNNALQDTSLAGAKVTVEIDSSVSLATIEKAELITGEEEEITSEVENVTFTFSESGNEVEDKAAERDERAEAAEFERDGLPELPDEEDDEEEKDGGGREEKEEVPRVTPGEDVAVRVTIRPYKAAPVEETLMVQIPEDMESGPATIDIYSGTRMRREIPGEVFDIQKEEDFHPQEQSKEGKMPDEEQPTPAETFGELVKDFVEMEKNNELVAVVNGSGKDALDVERWKKEYERKKAKKDTPWVLRGGATVNVRVSGSNGIRGGNIKKSRIKSLQEKQ